MSHATIELPGLMKMSEEQIAVLSPEEAGQLVDDLRQIKDIQRRLPGVKLCSATERETMSHRDVIEMILDVRQSALRTAV